MIEWRLQVCMANAGVRFASDLRKRLVEVLGDDDAPSEAHVARLVRTAPERLNLVTLEALCFVLDCTPNDLLYRTPPAEAAARAAR